MLSAFQLSTKMTVSLRDRGNMVLSKALNKTLRKA